MKLRLRVRGLAALDQRSATFRRALAWRQELELELGSTLSATRRTILDTATMRAVLLDHAYRWVIEKLEQQGVPGIVNGRRRSFYPIIGQLVSLSDSQDRAMAQLARQVLRIRRTFGHRDIVGEPKTRHSRRDVDVSPQLADLLKRHRKAQAEWKLAGRLAELPEFIFTEPAGCPLARRTFERAFSVVLRKAGLGPQHSPKSLRHAYASVMISEGANLLYVSRQLGHASVAVTEKHYTRWIPQAVPAVHQLDDSEPSGSKKAGFGNSAAANSATVQAIG